MKKVRSIIMIISVIMLLGGCNMFSKQNTIQLSQEYELLCVSRNTVNKDLCRETMNQLPKFESDINSYLKDKFSLDGFKLTGISFPYDSFNHGGFHATFQLEIDSYVMISSTFDYKDGKYAIRSATSEEQAKAGQSVLANAIILATYYKTLPLEKISSELENIGITTGNDNRLYYGLNSGRYFKGKNLISNLENSVVILTENEKINTIKEYVDNKNYVISKSHKDEIATYLQILPLTYAKNDNDIKLLFRKYQDYKKQHTEYGSVLGPGIDFYNNRNSVEEKSIALNAEGKETIYE